MTDTSLRLRPHHLLCMLTYIGKGYSRAFTDNFKTITTALNTGNATIEIVRGPDDICAPRLCDPEDDCHCHDADIAADDEAALADIQALIPALSYGAKLTLTAEIIRQLRAAYDKKTIRRACAGCQWFDLCTQVSENEYRDAYLDG